MDIFRDKLLRKTIFIAILILIAFEMISFFSTQYKLRIDESELYEHSYAIEVEIEKVFLNVYTVSEAYMSFMETNPNVTFEENEAFLDHLMEYEGIYVRNIAYLEDTTIKFNYPFEENSSSIGIDLSLIEDQAETVLFVKSNQDEVFIGPITLVQGGQAFILRDAVVIDNIYYGQISTVIDADKLIDILNDNAEAYDVSIAITDGNGEKIITLGDKSDSSITIDVNNERIDWIVEVYKNTSNQANAFISYGIRLFGLLTAIVVSTFAYRNGKLHEEVLFKANHDSLTSDYNRTKFVDDFNSGLFQGMLIAFTDINKFKVLNDTLGHQFGDWGLIEISKKFNASGKFITYRNSGDEFIIASKKPMAQETFLEYVKEFNALIHSEQLNQDISITLSIGVIEKIPNDLSLETMLIYLDYAMYDAKKAGKTYTLVNTELMEKYADQKIIENMIIHDINDNVLQVFYHPIINLKTKKIEGIEALSRWVREGEYVAASKFIEIVKKIKHIEKVDQNLFNNVQKEYLDIMNEDIEIKDMYFAINLSAETLKMFENDYSKFDLFVKNIKIPKRQIIFEISEDINLGIISEETLDYIRKQGYELTIDDFGSGFSKLTDVLSGQISAIKTDKSMVPKSKNEQEKWTAFNTIINAINASGSNVCVEGIETVEQLKLTINAGASSAQGYLFTKPIPYSELIDFVRNFNFEQYLDDTYKSDI